MPSSSIVSTGSIGELVAQIILLIAKFNINIERVFFSNHVYVEEFLISLIGKEYF